ncbi:MAG: zincin-like metallopeptidase domain-containing protein [Pseudomonadota bacterium]
MTRPRDPARPRPERPDLYATVTAQIIADLERGVRPWTRPWEAAHAAGPVSRPLRHTLEPYSGINVLLLWSRSMVSGFEAPIWMTFRQALSLGGHVRKGEHGETVVYANRITRTEDDPNGEDVERSIPFLKAYTVFNIAQIDGLPERFAGPVKEPLPAQHRIAAADAFFAATGAGIRHGGDSAFYSPAVDQVTMPPFERFSDPEAYYATLAHECTHWTGHRSRLDRDQTGRFGSPDYAREELVAELGAAFLCADMGLALTPRADHAAYIDHWLKALSDDRRLIFAAAAQAQRACDLLSGRSAG